MNEKLSDNPRMFDIKEVLENCIEIWLGKPNDSESELVIRINRNYIPALIASLKLFQTR